MPQFIITPWKNGAELIQVRHELYSGDPSVRRHAVDWVAAWRMRGTMPHAIESTAAIVDAQLHHDPAQNSPFSIRATYAAAVGRFVTGYCDITQTSAVRRSMYDVAEQIGMPVSLVEVRHEATHAELPSLQRLERHAAMALEWLWQNYWSHIDKSNARPTAMEETDDTGVRGQISNILSSFIADRRKEIRARPAEASQVSRDAAQSLIQLANGKTANLGTLAEEICHEKVLVAAGRRTNDLMKGAFLLWDDLLQNLQALQSRFIEHLLQHLVVLLTKNATIMTDEDPRQGFHNGLYRWILHIISEPPWMPGVSDATVCMILDECILADANGARLAHKFLKARQNDSIATRYRPILDDLENQS